jgi:hypothetical protein
MESIRKSTTVWTCARLLPGEPKVFCRAPNDIVNPTCAICGGKRGLYSQAMKNGAVVGTFCGPNMVRYLEKEEAAPAEEKK